MDWLNKLKESFLGSAQSDGAEKPDGTLPASDLDIEMFEGLMTEYMAISYCLTDLFLDEELDIDRFAEELDPHAITIAQALHKKDIGEAELTEEELEHHIKNEWFLYYGEALILKSSVQYGLDQNATKESFSQDLIDDLIIELSGANYLAYNTFCSFMGYSNTEMPPQRIVECVRYASEREMSVGTELTSWYPRANALMPDDDFKIGFKQDTQPKI